MPDLQPVPADAQPAGPVRPTLREEGRATMALALPLVAGQVSQMLIGLSDTVMIGRVGVVPLAASTFANSILYLPLMIGIGMAVAVSVRVSQARGSGDASGVRAALRHGIYLSLIVGAVSTLLAWLLRPHLPLFRQTPEVVEAVPHYLMLVAVSLIPAMAALVVKHYADAMNRPWPAFWIMLGGVGANVALNWVFIYGNLGAPELGLEGAGLATLLARALTLVALIAWCVRSPSLQGWVPGRWLRAPNWPAVRQLAAIGLPTSLQLLAEVSAFVAATLMIGTLGETALASHQVAITCAATVFMVPLGISMAVTVRVGEAWGAGEPFRLRTILLAGWLLGAVFTVFSAIGMITGNEMIAGWFVDDPDARALTAGLLLISAAFQFSDNVQIMSGGALRGLGDVNVPAVITFCAFWVVALPAGSVLAFPQGLGARGVWWGLTLGLSTSAVLLGLRAWRRTAPPTAA